MTSRQLATLFFFSEFREMIREALTPAAELFEMGGEEVCGEVHAIPVNLTVYVLEEVKTSVTTQILGVDIGTVQRCISSRLVNLKEVVFSACT